MDAQLRELLDFYEYNGEETPIVRGSALQALEGNDGEYGSQSILKLMEAVDNHLPLPPRDLDKDFLMPVEDVFSISGRGTVATGRIERGIVKVGDDLEVVGIKPQPQKTTCTGVEMFKKSLDQGQAGDNVGILLRGLKRDEIDRGQVLAKPGSVKLNKKFQAEVYVLKKDEGGRHTPFFAGYKPQFFIRTADITGGVTELKEGVEMVMPGDNTQLTCELMYPVPLDEGLRFALREGGRTVGAGVVSKVLD